MELVVLVIELNMVKSFLWILEFERIEVVEESKELKCEVKYLKYVFFYCEDV